ncbi:MAG: formylglycine-generating enzyme family protein [Thermoguttaceae bacterium]|nr:formylglycine-generating enzyme family protein [Thermoguttaceae bacterium]
MKRRNQRRLRGALASAFGLVALGLIPLGFGGAEQNATPIFAQTANADEPVDFKTLYAKLRKALSEGDGELANRVFEELAKGAQTPQDNIVLANIRAITEGYLACFPDGANVWRAGKKAGERRVLKINGVEFPFRWCPPGTFTTGCAPNHNIIDRVAHVDGKVVYAPNKGGDKSEKQHKVRLTKGFWILETEVTQEMWAALSGGANPSAFSGDSNPAEKVSWFDCQAALIGMNGLPFITFPLMSPNLQLPAFIIRLPTEAEWEYACRAGTTGPFNDNGNNGVSVGWFKQSQTSPVAQKKPNAWGIYDMHGNVWEWCWDWYSENAYFVNGAVVNPAGPSEGRRRVRRGGSFESGADDARSGKRDLFWPAATESDIGFRFILAETSLQEYAKWSERIMTAMKEQEKRKKEEEEENVSDWERAKELAERENLPGASQSSTDDYFRSMQQAYESPYPWSTPTPYSGGYTPTPVPGYVPGGTPTPIPGYGSGFTPVPIQIYGPEYYDMLFDALGIGVGY